MQHLVRSLATGALAALLATSSASAQDKGRVEWITLGTAGGPILHHDAAQISNALVVDGNVYLFDLGNSVLRQLDGAKLRISQIRAAFISHHHPDHNADTGLLIVSNGTFGRPDAPLPIIGARGTKALVAGLVSANATTEIAMYNPVGLQPRPLAETVRAEDVPAGLAQPTLVYRDERIKVWAIEVEHFKLPPITALPYRPSSLAFRIETGGRTFVYTGDTGMTENLVTLAKGADTLVTEVALDDPKVLEAAFRAQMKGEPEDVIQKRILNNRINHLSPADIGQIAARAGVRRIILTHHAPAPTVTQEQDAKAKIGASFKGEVDLARDLDRF